MGYLEGSKVGYEQTVNPWATALNQISSSFERRRAEEAKNKQEELQLTRLFQELSKKEDLARETQRLKAEQDDKIKRGQIPLEEAAKHGFTKVPSSPMGNTPVGAIGTAMQPNPEATMSLSGGGVGNTEGMPVPRETAMAQGMLQQTGISPKKRIKIGEDEYEQQWENPDDRLKQAQIDYYEKAARGEKPEGMEVTGYNSKGMPMYRAPTAADKKFKAEQEANEEVKKQKSKMVLNTAQDTKNTIAEIRKGMKFFGARSYIPAIPGSDKSNWNANVNKLLAKKVIDTIMQMKDASKTGATGFGQLNLAELKKLEDASTALKRDLSAKDAERYLKIMEDGVDKIMGGEQGGGQGQNQGQSDEYEQMKALIGQ